MRDSDRLLYDAKATYAVHRDDRRDLTIMRIDRTDGRVSAAACADKDVEDPFPWHLRSDELWLHSTRWISGEPQLSILNARTLAPVGANRLHVRDCSEEMRLRLKM
ncbi:MAG: hypothetical protein U0174_19540 [Polyangiaceae bacterium]